MAAWRAAVKAEEAPAKVAAATAKAVATLQATEGKLKQMELNLKYGPKTLEDALEEFARARARGDENPEKAKELESAEKFLASCQKEIDKLNCDIENAGAAVVKAKGLAHAVPIEKQATTGGDSMAGEVAGGGSANNRPSTTSVRPRSCAESARPLLKR